MAALTASERLLSIPDLIMFLEVHPHWLPRYGSSAEEVGDFLKVRGFSLYQINGFRTSQAVNVTEIDNLKSLASESGDMLIVSRKSAEELESGPQL